MPIDDGGAPITGYHVEAKARGDEEWQLWETVDTNTPMASMQKLQAGREYQFRVTAINKAGRSEASHPSRHKEARAQNCKLHIRVIQKLVPENYYVICIAMYVM